MKKFLFWRFKTSDQTSSINFNIKYLLSGIGIFFMDLFSISIILKLHSRQSIDNFGMRHEFVLFVLIITIISVIHFIIIKDKWIRLWIINLPIHLSTLFVNIFQLNEQLSIQTTSKTNETNESNNNGEKSYVDHIKLIDILGHSIGINEFARFLISELSLEHLLFLIKVSQFRSEFDKEFIEEQLDENIEQTRQNQYEYRYKLSSKIPICATIIDYQ